MPAILGSAGVEKVIEIELTPEEQKAFDKSVEAVRGLVKEVDNLL